MEQKNDDDFSFQLLANPIKLKRKGKREIITEEDALFVKIKKKYNDMLIFNSDKTKILNKIESILIDITISNIIENLVREIEYEHLL